MEERLIAFAAAEPYAACAVAVLGVLILGLVLEAAVERLRKYGPGLAVAAGLIVVAAVALIRSA